MKKTIIKLLAIFLIPFSTLCLSCNLVSAADYKPCDSSIPEVIREANGCDGNEDKLSNVVMGIINSVLGIISTVALIFIIIGGYNYMTSAGDPGKVKKAKDTLTYAIIGLVVVILAAVIVNFVINAVKNKPSSYSNADKCAKAGYTWDAKTNECK